MQSSLPLMPTDHAAAYCGCSPSTFKTFRSQQRGPAYYRTGKRVLYKPADLDAWLETKRIDPCPADNHAGVDT